LDEIPSVTSQGFPASFVDHGEPGIRNYNSGLCLKDGARFLATRRFNHDKWRYEILIKYLNGVAALPVRVLDLPRPHGRESHEDARLFWHRDRLYCAYTEGQYWQRPWIAVQKLALLGDDWSVEKVYTIGYGENTITPEKNWMFFSHDDRLHFVYSIEPHIVVELDDEMRVVGEFVGGRTTDVLPLRGGTPPVRMDHYYVTFPHFHERHSTRKRRYGFSMLCFEARAPFAVLQTSVPIIRASAEDATLPNPMYPHWEPLVVFPCGALYSDGLWMVVAGINDSFDAIFVIDPHAIPRRVQRRPQEKVSAQP
jgi:hypothetical protein